MTSPKGLKGDAEGSPSPFGLEGSSLFVLDAKVPVLSERL